MTPPQPVSPAAKAFVDRVANRSAVVGVVGLGYVGLPLVLAFHTAGFRVVGLDIDPRKVDDLLAGRSYIRHIPAEHIAGLNASGRFAPTTDFSRAAECEALLICVPTPLTTHREPDLTYVANTVRSLAPHLKKDALLVLESTTYPGTTEEVVIPEAEAHSPLRAGRDFFVAYSPEREDPNNKDYSTSTIPKVVGGLTPDCCAVACALYDQIIVRTVPVSSLKAAEATKLLENIFRSVNIALVNELKLLFERMDINVWEVIDAASTKPFGYMPFYPGPGLGGHCIPIDPFYLTWKAREYDFPTRFIELAGEINVRMPYEVVESLARGLNESGRPTRDARVLVLGVAYKKNVDDIRESPALKVIDLLRQRGCLVSYFDPYVPHFHSERHGELDAEPLADLTDAALRDADVVLILTDHDAVDYERVVREARLVVDTRNATRRVTAGREKIRLA